MRYTPGPWKLRNGAIYREDDAPIAKMVRDNRAYDACIYPVERDANARLIAAAPDLLEALKLLVGLIENNTLVRDISHDGDADWAVKQLPLVMTLKTVQKAIAKAEGKED